ncbi:MAG: FG-GAP repeat domain-containing protein, partial [Gemmataceae bacterium]
FRSAEVGKKAVFFHHGGASETCIDNYWYQAYAGGEWWNMSHAEPYLLRSFAGKPEKLAAFLDKILAGQEVVVPCMVDGDKNALQLRKAKMQRLKVSLKIQDYNPKRDFVSWGGGEDFERLAGMPGFTHYSPLTRVDPDAQAISSLDFDGDGKADLCLVGGGKVALVQNGGESMNEVSLPGAVGGRAAVWADYNNDGKPDLFLATLTGPKLYTNTGTGFEDDSHLLPQEPYYNLTAAAWMDQDGDGKPDLLLGNGFHGLRLYRNAGAPQGGVASTKPVLGKWYFAGPFDNPGQNGFNVVYPPEKGVNLQEEYTGKGNAKFKWREGNFKDGQINNLALFGGAGNNDAVVYLYREIEVGVPAVLPVSLGSDDTLTVWLNGERVHAENVYRGAAPDQAKLDLKLKPGKNQLLMKICQGTGDWGFYFAATAPTVKPITWHFEDISTKVGLGPTGLGSTAKGDTLTVADINHDGRPDFLYGAGTGLVAFNTPQGFVEAKNTGIAYKTGKVGPTFVDFDGDGKLDLLVPQHGACKLFKGNGAGAFTDVTAQAGDLAQPIPYASCAGWGDFDNDGKLDLVIGTIRGQNRFFRNLGNGKFADQTEQIGLHQRYFNTQALCLVDLNNDGVLDMVFNNEAQDSAILLGNKERVADSKHTPLVVQVNGTGGVIGSQVRLLDKAGQPQSIQYLSGGEGRGGQSPLLARFTVPPGDYRVEVRYSSGVVRAKEFKIADSPMRGVIDDQTPKVN